MEGFKTGDKIKCIEYYADCVTLGKEYLIVEAGFGGVVIVDDEADDIGIGFKEMGVTFKKVEEEMEELKVGDELECIKSWSDWITLGNLYRVSKVNKNNGFDIIDDEGDENGFSWDDYEEYFNKAPTVSEEIKNHIDKLNPDYRAKYPNALGWGWSTAWIPTAKNLRFMVNEEEYVVNSDCTENLCEALFTFNFNHTLCDYQGAGALTTDDKLADELENLETCLKEVGFLDEDSSEPEKHSGEKYMKKPVVYENGLSDIYCDLIKYKITNPAIQHAFKKVAMSGERGKGDKIQDLEEAIDAIKQAILLEKLNE